MNDRLVGTWRLVSFVATDSDGHETHTYGPQPFGVLMYDRGGRMSVQLSRSGRPRFKSDDAFQGTPEEVKEAFEGYFGYFGRYTVDDRNAIVTHHIESSSAPNLDGTDQRRLFALEKDRLILKTPPGLALTYVAVWERQS